MCFLIIVVYLYYRPEITNENNVVTIKGRLRESPRHVEGGETPSYILIYVSEYEKQYFTAGNCSMSLTPDSFFQMKPGDSIQLVVNKSHLSEEDGGVNVLGIKTEKYGELLNIKHVNQCLSNGWVRVLWLTIILAFVFSFPAIRKKLQKKRFQQTSAHAVLAIQVY